MSDGIKLIAGLGNIGPEYASTRHNAGIWFINHLVQTYQTTLRFEAKFGGSWAKVSADAASFLLFIPNRYMNESGPPIAAITHFYKLKPKELLIVHDELDFYAGKIKLKDGGGDGGHNGLRDIIEKLGTPDFYRLRIGIGHPGHQHQVTPYVLGRPSAVDREKIMGAIEVAAQQVIPLLVKGEIQRAMQTLHGADNGL